MSALTDRIAAAHQRIFNAQFGRGPHCICGWIHHDYDGSQKHVRHVAEVTEAAVREQVARDIEANYLGPDFGRNPISGQDSPHAMHAEAYDEGLADAARIARGGAV